MVELASRGKERPGLANSNVGIADGAMRVGAGERGLVVEVDGPAHCAADNPREALGGTLMRNTLLHALGWQVVVGEGGNYAWKLYVLS